MIVGPTRCLVNIKVFLSYNPFGIIVVKYYVFNGKKYFHFNVMRLGEKYKFLDYI